MSAQIDAGGTPAERTPASGFLDELSAVYEFLLVADSRGRVRWSSPGWSRLCPVSGDPIGRDLRELIPRLPRPEQSWEIRSRLRDRDFFRSSEVELGVGDRRVSFDFTIFPVFPEPGRPAQLVAIGRPADQRTPRPASNRILEISPDPVIAVDAQGFVTRVNPAATRLLGVSADEIEGSAVAVLASEIDGMLGLAAALAGPGASEQQLSVRRRAAAPLPVSVAVARDPVTGGGVLALRDLAAEQRMLADLVRRCDQLEHCVNTLAHDLRSPLVALLGFSRLLRQDYGDRLDDTGAHFIDRIEQAGRTMEALIHDLLELSRIGRPGEHPVLIDPRSVLTQLAAELKPRLEADGIELRMPDHPPLLYCDRTRLYQVFSNLIGNAIDHMGEGVHRRIAVEIAAEGDLHHIRVRDWGRGIPPEHHERIFEAFQSLGSRRDGARGTGMGLAIVRKIAESRGGRAWVESRSGEGAVFHVTLARRV
jgi:signal transduction histidine kinase